MTVYKVKAGDRISAREFNKLAEYANPVTQIRDNAAASKQVKCTWKNNGNVTVPAGYAAAGTWRDAGADASAARLRFLNDGICLGGTGAEQSGNSFPMVTLLKTAWPGETVPARCEGVFFGLVKVGNDDDGSSAPTTAGLCSVDANGCQITSGGGDYEICAASMPGTIGGAVYRFCAMRATKTSAGHLVGEIRATLNYNGTATVYVSGRDNISARCPLLRSGESISVQQGGAVKVILSKNLDTGNWEIIEAQCPANS